MLLETFPISAEHFTRIKKLLFWHTASSSHSPCLSWEISTPEGFHALINAVQGTGWRRWGSVCSCRGWNLTGITEMSWNSSQGYGAAVWMATGSLGQTSKAGDLSFPWEKLECTKLCLEMIMRQFMGQEWHSQQEDWTRLSPQMSSSLSNFKSVPSNAVASNLICGKAHFSTSQVVQQRKLKANPSWLTLN